MTYHPDCADCHERPASVFLPEGRYLCRPCWKRLKAVRIAALDRVAGRSSGRALKVPPQNGTAGY